MGSVSIKIKHCVSSEREIGLQSLSKAALHGNWVAIFHFSVWMIDKLDEVWG